MKYESHKNIIAYGTICTNEEGFIGIHASMAHGGFLGWGNAWQHCPLPPCGLNCIALNPCAHACALCVFQGILYAIPRVHLSEVTGIGIVPFI